MLWYNGSRVIRRSYDQIHLMYHFKKWAPNESVWIVPNLVHPYG
jgi:hypothetical protein